MLKTPLISVRDPFILTLDVENVNQMMHKFVNADLLHALSLTKFSGQVAYGQRSAMTESNMKKASNWKAQEQGISAEGSCER
jgi:hypothetical protein